MKLSAHANRFEQALYFVLEQEKGFVDDKDDPGGPTNYGITLDTLIRNGTDINGDGKIDTVDIQGLEIDLAVEIYRTQFWNYIGLDKEKDWKFAIAMFDTAVNVGANRAARWRNRVRGSKNPVQALLNIRVIHYLTIIKKNPVLSKYRAGWLSRVVELRKFLEVLDGGN